MTAKTDLEALEAKIATVNREYAVAQAKLEAARTRREAAEKALLENFKVSTLEEAQELLKKLEDAFDKEILAASTALEESL